MQTKRCHQAEFAARAAYKTSERFRISSALKSLHWLKIEQKIEYKINSATYKILQSKKPVYPHTLLNIIHLYELTQSSKSSLSNALRFSSVQNYN